MAPDFQSTNFCFHPLAVHLQKPPMVHPVAQNTVVALQQQIATQQQQQQQPSLGTVGTQQQQQQSLTPAQAVQQQLRLQRLQLEQDRLRQRQQEIIAMVCLSSKILHHSSNLLMPSRWNERLASASRKTRWEEVHNSNSKRSRSRATLA